MFNIERAWYLGRLLRFRVSCTMPLTGCPVPRDNHAHAFTHTQTEAPSLCPDKMFPNTSSPSDRRCVREYSSPTTPAAADTRPTRSAGGVAMQFFSRPRSEPLHGEGVQNHTLITFYTLTHKLLPGGVELLENWKMFEIVTANPTPSKM